MKPLRLGADLFADISETVYSATVFIVDLLQLFVFRNRPKQSP